MGGGSDVEKGESKKKLTLQERVKLYQTPEAKQPEEIEDAKKLAENLTIQQRLMRRLHTRTAKIPLQDDLGEFYVEVHLLSPAEQEEIRGFYQKLTAVSEDLDKAIANPNEKLIKQLTRKSTKLLDKLYHYAESVCVDPSLNYEFWKTGEGFLASDPSRIVSETLMASQGLGTAREERRDLNKFRA